MADDMKKVLIIAGGLQLGGAERVARDIGWFADRSRFQIHYLVFGEQIGDFEKELKQIGCKIVRMPSPGENHVTFYRELYRLIKRERYDVVHSHTMFNSGLSMLAAKQCRVPVRIAHSHSIRGSEHRGLLKNLYEKTMRLLILQCATAYVACGKQAGEWLFGREKFDKCGILLYNGIALEQFRFRAEIRQQLREQEGLENRFVIGHAGHLAAVKNQKFLLERMREIQKQRPDALLLLLGEGEDRPMLEQTIHSLGLEDSVRMTGNVDNVAMWLNAMDVFAFPSLYEGMPLAIMEAQANGLPCVISENVPKDVRLTKLIQALPLNRPEAWVTALCDARREKPEMYCETLRKMGLDTAQMLEKIYRLYEGIPYETAGNHRENSI